SPLFSGGILPCRMREGVTNGNKPTEIQAILRWRMVPAPATARDQPTTVIHPPFAPPPTGPPARDWTLWRPKFRRARRLFPRATERFSPFRFLPTGPVRQ